MKMNTDSNIIFYLKRITLAIEAIARYLCGGGANE